MYVKLDRKAMKMHEKNMEWQKSSKKNQLSSTAWKVSKYGPVSGPNAGKYGPEETPYLDAFHAVGGIIFDLVRKLFELSLLKIIDESVAKQEKFKILFEEFVTAW